MWQRPGHPDARPDSPALHTNPYEFRYLTEFQSHEPEFDYLKSLEIEEKINKVRWVRGRCGGRTHMLLTTNDKTIKLWKVRGQAGERAAAGWRGWVVAGVKQSTALLPIHSSRGAGIAPAQAPPGRRGFACLDGVWGGAVAGLQVACRCSVLPALPWRCSLTQPGPALLSTRVPAWLPAGV
jgi:hypothetical protein